MQIDGISAEIRIIRSNRKRMIAQTDVYGNVIVRAPHRVSEARIRAFLQKYAAVIEQQSQQQREKAEAEGFPQPFTAAEIAAMTATAKRVIPARAAYYAAQVGVTYGRITIRHQKTKWGSCSGKGNLNFNCLLMAAPPEVMDAVIVHELCHLKYMNHSREFYALVRSILPDYDQRHAWLDKHGAMMIRRLGA